MNLKELKAAGGFVPAEAVKRSVVWERAPGDEVTFDIYVKRLSFGSVERMLTETNENRSRSAELIAACVRLGENGADALTYDDAYNLEPSLAKAIGEAVREVNELGKQNR